MSQLSILLTGASGLLGTNLSIQADRPSHVELDITKPVKTGKYSLVIHSAAYTKVPKAETDRLECFDVNVRGTLNLLEAYPTTPFVYISSEYAHNPVNFYSITKSLAEQLVTTHPNYLIIRTLFKPYPWPYEKAFTDQFTQGDYVQLIAPLIEKEIKEWDRKSKMIYVGTGRKTIFDLAQRSRPDIRPMLLKDITNVKLPQDYQ